MGASGVSVSIGSRPHKQPTVIPDLKTLRPFTDARVLHRHLRKEYCAKETWYLKTLDEAAGGWIQPIEVAKVTLKLINFDQTQLYVRAAGASARAQTQ
jgi:hypothetical protein